jgi:hypothetical protein
MVVQYAAIKWSVASEDYDYEAIVDVDEQYDDLDFLDGCAGEVYELGSDDCPDWVVDIRGLICDEPDRVFVERAGNEQRIYYFGFVPAKLSGGES